MGPPFDTGNPDGNSFVPFRLGKEHWLAGASNGFKPAPESNAMEMDGP